MTRSTPERERSVASAPYRFQEEQIPSGTAFRTIGGDNGPNSKGPRSLTTGRLRPESGHTSCKISQIQNYLDGASITCSNTSRSSITKTATCVPPSPPVISFSRFCSQPWNFREFWKKVVEVRAFTDTSRRTSGLLLFSINSAS